MSFDKMLNPAYRRKPVPFVPEIPQPHFIPGYSGFIPGYKNEFGSSFGKLTHKIVESDPIVGGRLKNFVETPERMIDLEKQKLTDIQTSLRCRKAPSNGRMFRDYVPPGYSGHIPNSSDQVGVGYNRCYLNGVAEFQKQQEMLNAERDEECYCDDCKAARQHEMQQKLCDCPCIYGSCCKTASQAPYGCRFRNNNIQTSQSRIMCTKRSNITACGQQTEPFRQQTSSCSQQNLRFCSQAPCSQQNSAYNPQTVPYNQQTSAFNPHTVPCYQQTSAFNPQTVPCNQQASPYGQINREQGMRRCCTCGHECCNMSH